MYSFNHRKLQQLAVANKVPAWAVMIDLRRSAFENTFRHALVLMDKAGRQLMNIEDTAFKSWDRFEAALVEYAATQEGKAEWARYEEESCPAIGIPF